MDPNRFSSGEGKHRCLMAASTAGGRFVGPGEKLSTLFVGQLVGGVSEPQRAGWSGWILAVLTVQGRESVM